MADISKAMVIDLPAEQVFDQFINHIIEWWPKEYTWSQDKLEAFRIEGKKGGLCSEIGPDGFRCDWGRVTDIAKNKKIAFKWQVGPHREPVPDPDRASNIEVRFNRNGTTTLMEFEHFNFRNHGEGDDYRKMMDGDRGWDYILSEFKAHCEYVGESLTHHSRRP